MTKLNQQVSDGSQFPSKSICQMRRFLRPQHNRGRISVAGLIGILAIVAVAGVGGYAVKRFFDTTAGAINQLGSAFKPSVNVSVVVTGVAKELSPTLQLKVGERLIDAESRYTQDSEWLGIPFGKTVTTLRFDDNRVQYVTDLRNLNVASFQFIGTEEGGGALLVSLPRPVLDANMVSIQTDPAKVFVEVDDQWLNNTFVWMGDGRTEATHLIKTRVEEIGKASPLLREVELEAEPRINALLQQVLNSSLRSNVQVKVMWKE